MHSAQTHETAVAARLLVPVDHLGELPALLATGAGEFFGGVLPPGWGSAYPELCSVNRRNFAEAQFSSVLEMKSAIASCAAEGRGFHLTLNLTHYPRGVTGALVDLAGDLATAGLSGVILADPDLAVALAAAHPRLLLTASTMAVAINAAAVDCWRGFGVERFVLPRYATLGEVASIADANPESTFEVFLMMGKCPNIEGLCRLLHDDPRRVWPCVSSYRVVEGETIGQGRWGVTGWEGYGRFRSCGLCALPALLDHPNVRFKIVGRGAPTDRKISAIGAVLQAGRHLGEQEYPARCREIFAGLFGEPCGPRHCYFPYDGFAPPEG